MGIYCITFTAMATKIKAKSSWYLIYHQFRGKMGLKPYLLSNFLKFDCANDSKFQAYVSIESGDW